MYILLKLVHYVKHAYTISLSLTLQHRRYHNSDLLFVCLALVDVLRFSAPGRRVSRGIGL